MPHYEHTDNDIDQNVKHIITKSHAAHIVKTPKHDNAPNIKVSTQRQEGACHDIAHSQE